MKFLICHIQSCPLNFLEDTVGSMIYMEGTGNNFLILALEKDCGLIFLVMVSSSISSWSYVEDYNRLYVSLVLVSSQVSASLSAIIFKWTGSRSCLNGVLLSWWILTWTNILITFSEGSRCEIFWNTFHSGMNYAVEYMNFVIVYIYNMFWWNSNSQCVLLCR